MTNNEANQFAVSEIKRLHTLNKQLQEQIKILILKYCPDQLTKELNDKNEN